MRISVIGQAASGKSYHINAYANYTGYQWVKHEEGHRRYIVDDNATYIDLYHHLVNNVDGIIFMVDVHNKKDLEYINNAYWFTHEMGVSMVICGNNKTGEDPLITSKDFARLNAPYFAVNSNTTIGEAVQFICDDVKNNKM